MKHVKYVRRLQDGSIKEEKIKKNFSRCTSNMWSKFFFLFFEGHILIENESKVQIFRGSKKFKLSDYHPSPWNPEVA